ncbi:MAG: hypothetical protein U1E81_20060 [Xanthobacteraceae bacterium]
MLPWMIGWPGGCGIVFELGLIDHPISLERGQTDLRRRVRRARPRRMTIAAVPGTGAAAQFSCGLSRPIPSGHALGCGHAQGCEHAPVTRDNAAQRRAWTARPLYFAAG